MIIAQMQWDNVQRWRIRQHTCIPPQDRTRQRPIDSQLLSQLESSVPAHQWNTGVAVIVIVKDMVEYATLVKSSTVARVATRWVARSKVVGDVVNTVALSLLFFEKCCTFVLVFFLSDFVYRHWRLSCTRRKVKTEHFVAHSTHAFFLVAHSTVVSHLTFHPMHLLWLKAWWNKSAFVSRIEHSSLTPQSVLHPMSGRNLLGLLERQFPLPDVVENE